MNNSTNSTGGDKLVCSYDQNLQSFNLTLFALSVTLHVIALLSNTTVIVIYSKASRLTSTQVFLRNLAAADLAYAVVTPFYVYRYVYPYLGLGDQINYVQAATIAKYLTPVVHYIALVSTWFVVSATAVRYIASCRLDLNVAWNTPKRAMQITVIIMIAAAAWSSLDFIEKYSFDIIVKKCTGYYFFGKDHPMRKYDAYVFFVFTVWLIINHIAPSMFVLFCNIQFVLVLKKLRTSTRPTEGRVTDRMQKDLILLMMAVTAAFILLTFPAMVEHILWRVGSFSASIVQRIGHTCLLTNHVINFLIYTCLNKQFLTLFKTCCKQDGWWESSIGTSKPTKLPSTISRPS